MAPSYEVYLLTHDGNRLALLDQFTALQYIRVVNNVGRFSVSIPFDLLPTTLLAPDYRVEIWRGTDHVIKRREVWGFIRTIRYESDKSGNIQAVLSGPDAMDLLRRRIVAYRVGTSQAKKTAPADDMMKAIVRENLGSSSTTDYAGNSIAARDLTDEGLSVQQDLTDAPSLSKSFAWRNVMMVLQELAVASEELGTKLFFDIVPTETNTIQFRTYINQRGQDRREGQSNSPLILDPLFGNVADATCVMDFEQEITHAYAGGFGLSEIDTRIIVDVGDSYRANRSIWNRREAWHDGKTDDLTAEVTNAAKEKLRQGLPRNIFSGTLLDMPGTRYGLDWDFGDQVTINFINLGFGAMVRAVQVSYENGKEEITSRIQT